jgi:hypothetical protein
VLNRVWVGDITYLRTWESWLYLVTVIDAHSRRVIGWAIEEHMRTDLVEQALQMAITLRGAGRPAWRTAGRLPFPGMPASPIVVTATPTGARWFVEIPGHRPIAARTLSMAETMTARRLHAGFDLQVDLGGVEDLCADAVEAGEAADTAHITALKLRRSAVRALKVAPAASPSTSAT